MTLFFPRDATHYKKDGGTKEEKQATKNEENGGGEQKEVQRLQSLFLWNEWSRKTNKLHPLFHKTWCHPESG